MRILVVASTYYKDLSCAMLRDLFVFLNRPDLMDSEIFDNVSDFCDEKARVSSFEVSSDLTVDVAFVTGCLEIPIAVSILCGKYDGVVAMGCVIRGETDHYEHVCHMSNNKLYDVCVSRNLPVGNAILTVHDKEQAENRISKAREAFISCMELVRMKEFVQNDS